MALWFRARWLAIQRDGRWPALLAELTARGFRANTSEPEYGPLL